MAQYIRGAAAQEVQNALRHSDPDLLVEGSAGAGNWAAVPWVAILDRLVTESATREYYVVYLFHVSEPIIHLSLNQGTTSTREEFGPKTRQILADRADFMRKRLADFGDLLPVHTIELGSEARLPGDYAAGHALGFSYRTSALPSEDALRADLQTAVRVYRALIFRGGLELATEGDDAFEGDLVAKSLFEKRSIGFTEE
jgi:5-methylcytosine-specific restriction enzyme A